MYERAYLENYKSYKVGNTDASSRNSCAAQVGFIKVLQPQTAQTNTLCLLMGIIRFHFILVFINTVS